MSANDATAVVVYQLDEVACKYTFFSKIILDKSLDLCSLQTYNVKARMPSWLKEAW